MLQNTIEPRPSSCTTCGQSSVHPRIMQVKRGQNIVTEAHWICPKCNSRFLTGVLNTTPANGPKK
jgi:transposase-like protein